MLPRLAYWDNADEKWLSRLADASAMSYVRPQVNLVAAITHGSLYADTHTQIVSFAEPFVGSPYPQRLRGSSVISAELFQSGKAYIKALVSSQKWILRTTRLLPSPR